jgi:hypothetical protein
MEAYRLVPVAQFRGGAPSETLGWLHGERVEHEGRTFMLQGPPAIFISEPRQHVPNRFRVAQTARAPR